MFAIFSFNFIFIFLPFYVFRQCMYSKCSGSSVIASFGCTNFVIYQGYVSSFIWEMQYFLSSYMDMIFQHIHGYFNILWTIVTKTICTKWLSVKNFLKSLCLEFAYTNSYILFHIHINFSYTVEHNSIFSLSIGAMTLRMQPI
jgi:hypothetical protein